MSEEFNNEEDHLPPVEPEKLVAVISPVTTAFIALIGIFMTYQVGGAILTLLIFGMNFDKADVNAMRLLTMGGQILLMLLPTLLLAKYVYPLAITKMLRVKFPNLKEIGVFLLGLVLLLPLLQNFLAIQSFFLEKASGLFPFIKKITEVLDQLDKLVESTYGELLKSNSIFESSFIIIVVAVVPALCEEFLFRGLVQKSFEQRYSPYISIFITSLFFGLYHFNPYGLIALVALGFYFGFAAYLSDSIFVPMVLHFTNNLLAVLAFLILGSDELMSTNIKPDSSILSSAISFAVLLVLFTAFLIYVKTNYKKLVTSEGEKL